MKEWFFILIGLEGIVTLMRYVAIKSESYPWWSAFFAEFFAALIILIIATFVIPRYLDWRKRPDIPLINLETGEDTFSLGETETNYNTLLHLAIVNKKQVSLSNIFWHLYIPKVLNPIFRNGFSCSPKIHIMNGDEWLYYNGSIPGPLYPNRKSLFPHEIALTLEKTNEIKGYQIYYYFSTEYGTYPSKASSEHIFLKEPYVKVIEIKI